MRFGDRSWLTKPGDSTVHWLVEFEDKIERAELAATLQTRLVPLPRFSQSLERWCGGRPAWRRHIALQAADHVSEEELPAGATQAEVNVAVAAISARPLLTVGRPPWEAILLQGGPRGSILVLRVHHAMSDGRGLVEVMTHLQDDPQMGATMRHRLEVKRVTQDIYGPIIAGFEAVGDALVTMTPLLFGPDETLTSIKQAAPTNDVALGWAAPWSLVATKEAAHRLGGTINDFVMAAIAGGLRRLLLEHGDKPDDLHLHGVQIMAMPRGRLQRDGNAVTAIHTAIPIHLSEPRAQFAAVKRDMDRLKKSHTPEIMRLAHDCMTYLPIRLQHTLYARSSTQNSVIVSNVRGCPEAIRVASHRVVSMRWVGPRFGNIGLQFPVLSYCDALTVGISASAALPVSIDEIRTGLATSYDALLRASQP